MSEECSQTLMGQVHVDSYMQTGTLTLLHDII